MQVFVDKDLNSLYNCARFQDAVFNICAGCGSSIHCYVATQIVNLVEFFNYVSVNIINSFVLVIDFKSNLACSRQKTNDFRLRLKSEINPFLETLWILTGKSLELNQQ